MEFNNGEKLAAELLKIADAIRELELKKTDLEGEQQPLLEQFNEIHYKHLTDIENVKDAQSRELYSDEDRKQLELEHRLRIDPKVRELKTSLSQYKKEIDKTKIEIDYLEDRREILDSLFNTPELFEQPESKETEK